MRVMFLPTVPIMSVRSCGRRRSSRRAASSPPGKLSAADLKSDRRRRDQGDRRQAGGRSASVDHRRRVPARLLAFRFPRRARRRGDGRRRDGIKFAGVQSKAEAPFVKGKLGSRHHPQIAHFEFLKANTKRTPKMTIPSPSMLHYRGGRKMIDRAAYPTMDEFYRDLGQAYKQAIQGFYAAGCRYLQLDDCSFAYLCDPAQRDMLAERGDDPDKQGEIYAGMINAALDGRPRDLVVTTHVCRGNFRSTFIASGGYEPIADLLFNGGQCRRLFPRVGQRPRRRLRAAAVAAEGQDGGARPDHLEDRRARRQGLSEAPHRGSDEIRRRSSSFACRRNAVLPPPRKATCSRTRSNGPSCGWWSRSPRRCGGADAAAHRPSISRSIQTGTWSDGLSHERTWRSMPASASRSAACGDSSR